MISTSESNLKTYIMAIKLSSRLANEEIEVTVIGRCALLWVPGWPAVGNVKTMPHKRDKLPEKKCNDIRNLLP